MHHSVANRVGHRGGILRARPRSWIASLQCTIHSGQDAPPSPGLATVTTAPVFAPGLHLAYTPSDGFSSTKETLKLSIRQLGPLYAIGGKLAVISCHVRFR